MPLPLNKSRNDIDMRGQGGLRKIFAAAAMAVLVVSSLGATQATPASSLHSNVDPSLRAGALALVHTSAGRAGALSMKLSGLGAQDVQTYAAADTVIARLSTAALAELGSDRDVTVATTDAPIFALDGGRNSGFENYGSWPGFTRLSRLDGDRTKQLAQSATMSSASFLAIDAPQAWSKTTGEGATVAIMDTGVARVEDLKDSVKMRLDFVKDGNKLDDPAGHGTFIAGLIAADGVMKGVAPDAKIVSLRVLDANGSGTIAGVVGAFDWVLRHKDIDVLNLSWGAPQTSSYHKDLLSALVEATWASGVTVVAAAGNDGPNGGTVTTPGSDPFVVTVGSSDDHDTATTADDTLAPFSSRGPTLDGFAKPDTLAPGVHITSLRVPGLVYIGADGQPVGNVNDRFVHMTGTSASAGFVSGIAALVASYRKHATPNLAKGAIVASGRAISGSAAGEVDALTSLTDTPAVVNKNLAPSQLLLAILAKSGQLKVHGVTWEGVTWDGVTWDGVTWDSVSWESISWEGVTWEGVTWEGVTWEKLTKTKVKVSK